MEILDGSSSGYDLAEIVFGSGRKKDASHYLGVLRIHLIQCSIGASKDEALISRIPLEYGGPCSVSSGGRAIRVTLKRNSVAANDIDLIHHITARCGGIGYVKGQGGRSTIKHQGERVFCTRPG